MRTPGATSCIAVKLSDLNESLQPNAVVLVSRRWANTVGIGGKAIKLDNESIMSAGNQPLIQEKVYIREKTLPTPEPESEELTPMNDTPSLETPEQSS